MRFGSRRRPDASIELTPLIDVVFLLLIFFMVSTTFVRESRIAVDLPEAAGDGSEREGSMALAIDASGGYAVNGRALADGELETIEAALRESPVAAGGQRLLIAADAAVTHRAVVRAMDAARRAGIVRIDIATREPGR